MADPDLGVQLKRELGLLNGVTIIIGTIIGSGIFFTPSAVLSYSGNSIGISLLVWAVSGFVSFLGALCFAELGTTILKSGADYAYIKEAFGSVWAFLVLWINIFIIRPTVQAIVSMTFAQYALYSFFGSCNQEPKAAQILLAACCIGLLGFINGVSVKWAAKIQDIFTLAKVFALTVIIITGFYNILFLNKVENFENLFSTSEKFTIGRFSLAMYQGLFSYFGWNYLNFIVDELKNPYVNLPRAIYISIPIVTFIYIFTNIAYFTSMTAFEAASSPAIAVTMGDRVYGWFSFIIPLFVSLSCFGGVNGLLFTSGRLNVVGAQDGLLPSILAMIHTRANTPVPAMILTCILSIFMLFFDIYTLIDYVSVAIYASIGASILGQIRLRKTEPNRNRPIKFPLILPIFFFAICCFLFIVPLISSPDRTIAGFILILLGLPIYAIGMYCKQQKSVQLVMLDITTFLQKLLCVVSPIRVSCDSTGKISVIANELKTGKELDVSA